MLIEWVDSSGCSGWHHFDEGDRISRCVSVGILKYEDDEQIILISSRSDYGNVADSIAIPKVSIKRIRRLRTEGKCVNTKFGNATCVIRKHKRAVSQKSG